MKVLLALFLHPKKGTEHHRKMSWQEDTRKLCGEPGRIHIEQEVVRAMTVCNYTRSHIKAWNLRRGLSHYSQCLIEYVLSQGINSSKLALSSYMVMGSLHAGTEIIPWQHVHCMNTYTDAMHYYWQWAVQPLKRKQTKFSQYEEGLFLFCFVFFFLHETITWYWNNTHIL